MVNMTLAVPKELKHSMDDFPEINWSEVARAAFKRKIDALRIIKEFTSDSELTEQESIELGRKVNKALRKRYTRN